MLINIDRHWQCSENTTSTAGVTTIQRECLSKSFFERRAFWNIMTIFDFFKMRFVFNIELAKTIIQIFMPRWSRKASVIACTILANGRWSNGLHRWQTRQISHQQRRTRQQNLSQQLGVNKWVELLWFSSKHYQAPCITSHFFHWLFCWKSLLVLLREMPLVTILFDIFLWT